jgi:hypothetical protein
MECDKRCRVIRRTFYDRFGSRMREAPGKEEGMAMSKATSQATQATAPVSGLFGGYRIRRNPQGHAEAIERNGYTVLILAAGATRNEENVAQIVEMLNAR